MPCSFTGFEVNIVQDFQILIADRSYLKGELICNAAHQKGGLSREVNFEGFILFIHL